MTPWTADHRHLALVGIPASAMVPDARAVAAVYVVSGGAAVFELPGHGFSGTAALAGPERVRFAGDNINGVRLDSQIVPTIYYDVAVTPGDPDFFTVTTGAVPLVLAGDGCGLPFVLENIIPKIDLIMAEWTSKVVANAKAYRAPWFVAPLWAPMLIAHLAAPSVAAVLRVATARFDVADLQVNYERALKQYDDLGNGVPFDDGIGPVDADTTPNDTARATNSLLTGCVQDTRWLTGTL